MVRTQTAGQLASGLSETQDVFYDVLRAANERMFRMNRIFLDEAQRTQGERTDLFRTWLSSPTQVNQFNSQLFETLTRRNRRRMELFRTMIDDLRDFGAGTRSIWERLSDANRQTARAATNAGREVASTVTRQAANRAEDVSEAADEAVKNLRRQARENDPSNN
jgi:hypothetical protein